VRFVPRHLLSRGATDFRGIRTNSEAAKSAAGRTGHYTQAGIYARRKGEHGSAILESFLSMILLGLILFGILQLFQLVLADMVTDYAAFRGARSAAVGFRDEYAIREALIKAAPVSGPMTVPRSRRVSVETEQSFLRGYMEGDRNVEYANWLGEDRLHTNYHCPHYGEPLVGGCSLCSRGKKHYVDASVNGFDQTMRFKFEFVNYPLDLPLHDWLTGRDSIDISAESELTNHSSSFLE
jgi:hypothetical protein